MKTLFLFFLSLISANCLAQVYEIGSDKAYKNPNELYKANVVQKGDTIKIDGGEYRGETSLAIWRPDSLVITGVNGRPHR